VIVDRATALQRVQHKQARRSKCLENSLKSLWLYCTKIPPTFQLLTPSVPALIIPVAIYARGY